MKSSVRIGNASGFWGDEPTALRMQLAAGGLDVVVADYLAEVSMSILAKQQARNPELGYIADFIEHLSLAKDFLNNPTKIIVNAGGNNPLACAREVAKLLNAWSIPKKVMAVTGDNILDMLGNLPELTNMETGAPLQEIAGRVVSANVYTGAEGIIACLEAGADIVITGRASDSAPVVAAARYYLGWSATDWERLGAAMIAGHIIECGAQATGGNFTDWQKIDNMLDVGFPIVELYADGTMLVTKTPNTGGLVSVDTVREQLVYEIADPAAYLGPDVTADLRQLRVEQVGVDTVRVSGAGGHPAPEKLKVSVAYTDGYKCQGGLFMSGPDAQAKAELLNKQFWHRLREQSFSKTATQYIGYNAAHLVQYADKANCAEVLVQWVAFGPERKALEAFSKQIAAMILTGPQGVAATGGRPKVQEVYRYWPTLIERKYIQYQIHHVTLDHTYTLSTILPIQTTKTGFSISAIDRKSHVHENHSSTSFYEDSNTIDVPLKTICLARSGDKGNTANIGLLARSPEIFEFIVAYITASRVQAWFAHLCQGSITRYELPTIYALNFVLTEALDGGGTYSGRMDPQGKTLASFLLAQKVTIPVHLLHSVA